MVDYTTLRIRTVSAGSLGALSFFEGLRDIPFAIKRIYYIYDVPTGIQRGGQAHRILQQMLWCPYGSVKIKLDDGRQKEEVLLDRPDKGLVLRAGLWRDMLWLKSDSVLCVAASEYYNENDYIRDYDEFLKYVTSENASGENVTEIGENDKKLTGGEAITSPFGIRRVYYIYNVPKGIQRGGHAHKTLEQILSCPFGSVLVQIDDGSKKCEVLLDSPEKRLAIPPHYWHTMRWEKDNSVLCVVASDYYDESDYIRHYDEFLKIYGGTNEG